jgi:Protein of unknown function (DUF2855)
LSDHLTVTRLLTDKSHLGRTEVQSQDEPAAARDGAVLLKIDRFSITTNNITYAAFGDAMNYWDFFPTARTGWGHMPVWGFANVVASSVPGVEVGERFYGYYPITSLVRMRAERVSDRGFYDGAEHRRNLTSAYNQYGRCSFDPVYAAAREDYQALYRPLFITSFMLADFLEDNDFFGAKQLLVSSASSKTAYGTAFCLMGDKKVTLTALTSTRNARFVRGLQCYTATALYDELETLDPAVPTVYVDFSGDNALRSRIHHHFAAALTYDCYAGSAANTEFLAASDLPGPAPAFYFAPVQIKKRNADWGPSIVNQRFNAAQLRFIDRAARADAPWVRIVTGTGFGAAQEVIAMLEKGGGDPAIGHIIRLA